MDVAAFVGTGPWQRDISRTSHTVRGRFPNAANKRLKDLRELALIELGDNGFALTNLGLALVSKLASLDSWANDWADQLAERR